MKILISKRKKRANNLCVVSFFYREPLRDLNKGSELFDILSHNGLMADKFGIFPLPKKFQLVDSKLRAFLSNYWLPVILHSPTGKDIVKMQWLYIYRTGKPKYWGTILRNGGERAKYHSQISLNIEIDANSFDNMYELLSNLSAYAKTDFARVQYYTSEEELNSGQGDGPNISLVARQLSEECLPDLYNISIWGRPYIDFFGREKLLNTPCYNVRELSSGLIWMQLSADVFNARGSWTAIRDIRERVKTYLNNDAFYNPKLHIKELHFRDLENDPGLRDKFVRGELMNEQYKLYKVPNFDLSDIRQTLINPAEDSSQRAN